MEFLMHASSTDRVPAQAANTTSASSMWWRAISMTSAAMLLTSCNEGVLDPHGPVGKAERVILYDATAIMLAVVIPVIVLTLAFRVVVSSQKWPGALPSRTGNFPAGSR